MTEKTTHKPEIHWDQTEFEALKATWSQERIAEDKKRLSDVFNFAAKNPVFAAALDWATSHGIEFFVDRTLKGAWGYYTRGTGVVGIAADMSASPEFFDTVVHEIRHAWQDYHGFCAWPGDSGKENFAPFFINNALMEADAEAFGKQAKDPATALGESFLSWFASSFDTQFYGEHASKFCGKNWGLYDGPQPEHGMEFSPPQPEASVGINLDNLEDVKQLGRGFSGTGNYIAALSADVMPRQILNPSFANSFYGTATEEQKALTAGIRKAHLGQKLAHKLPGAAP